MRYGSRRGSVLAGKRTTENQISIDIRWLKKQRYLRQGHIGSLSWSCRGEQAGFILYHMEKDRMVLIYNYRQDGGEWEPVKQAVYFDRTPCNYGGHRAWFLCPNCWKRVAVLYGAGKYFLCRHCYNLAYASQQEGVLDRLLRRERNIRVRLGAIQNLFEPVLFKPKNMHQKTFDRLRMQAKHANILSTIIIGSRLGINI